MCSSDLAPPDQVLPFGGVSNGNGTFTFTWQGSNVGGVSYEVTEVRVGAKPTKVDVTTYTGLSECIEVESATASGSLSGAVRGCAKK